MKRFIQKLFSSDSESEKSPLKPRYFIILGLVGILVILISNIFQGKDEASMDFYEEPPSAEVEADTEMKNEIVSEINQLARSYEEDLVNMLNKIQGVADAEVMVNLDSSDVKVYERNMMAGTQTTSEEDQNGGTRQVEDRTEDSQVVLVRQGDTETPILVQTKRPDVRGVFVVAKGAEQAGVKARMIEAISSVLDVPSHRISVMPKD